LFINSCYLWTESLTMSYLNTKQSPESGVQYLENLYVTSMGNESNLLQQDGMTISWDQFMNELEFE
jgi:hypothetical protein